MIIGEPSTAPSSSSPPTQIEHADQLEDVQLGQWIAPFDWLMQWDEDCLPPSELEKWRFEGDELCDAVVEVLGLRPGQDGLELVVRHMALLEDERDQSVVEFWQQISRLPPPPLSASPSQGFTPLPSLHHLNRHPPPSISHGQAVFWRYSSQILSALQHFSLAGGFAAERIVGVLRETNYLTGRERDKTYRRLVETTQAILDYMNDMTPITGSGWKSAVRVRLLHSSVRVRIRRKAGITNTYDEAVNGIPINQEDLLCTLGSFAIAPLFTMRKAGIYLTKEEEEAYVGLWRHVGYYLGISPTHLERYFTSPSLVSKASKLFACTTMHLFSTDPDRPQSDLDPTKTSTYRILASACDRPPRPMPISYHLALSRFMLGSGLADRLVLPPTNNQDKWRIRRAMPLDWLIIHFGRYYRPRWERERVAATRLLLQMVICWKLGVKRTKFTIKEFGADATAPIPIEEAEAAHGAGEKGEWLAVDADDSDELDPEVEMGSTASKRIIGRWRWMLAEMGAVLLLPFLAVGAGLGVSMWEWSWSLYRF